MADELVVFQEKPSAQYLIAGWRRQWSDGGGISGGLPRYLIEKLEAKKIGELGSTVSSLCYPFQVAGTHDTFRPLAAYEDGLPSQPMHRENYFLRRRERSDHISGARALVPVGCLRRRLLPGYQGPWYHTDCRRRGCQRTGPSRHGKKNYLRLQ